MSVPGSALAYTRPAAATTLLHAPAYDTLARRPCANTSDPLTLRSSVVETAPATLRRQSGVKPTFSRAWRTSAPRVRG
ncbi:hypothetical protein GCM10008019_09740 [Deinococcus soli (ex Cha et al. 2016)]|nr:hypothetical protein GCM10008019_09740 [Deinococcus soli (ex Cha et al. 2016)]